MVTRYPIVGNVYAYLVTLFAVALALISNSTLAQVDFNIRASGFVNWVVDGDTAYIQPENEQVWVTLRDKAIAKQQRTGRDMNIDKNFRERYGTRSMKVRIGNIQTAELGTHEGEKASQFAKLRFKNDSAFFQCWEIGYYGRPICSVKTADGDWGELMIRSGYSPYWEKYGSHPFQHQSYLEAER